MTLLKDFTVLDFSLRLPGPLATHLLSELGATVIKVEDSVFKDPFLGSFIKEEKSNFQSWYQSLNKNKEIKRLDFNADKVKDELGALLGNADALVLSLPQKVKDKLSLNPSFLKENYSSLTVIELKASSKHKNLHDLNALALAGLLDMHTLKQDGLIIAPPFLPMAGITFGHWISTKLLAAKLAGSQWVEVSLEEAVKKVLLPFSSQGKVPLYLHNGKFPCYSIYKTKDAFLAVAAVEEKFWIEFNELFQLGLKSEDRFDVSPKVFELISQKLIDLSSKDLKLLLKDRDICVNLF